MRYSFFKYFFTHKDYISQMEKDGMYIPGKLFSPLHFVVSAIILAGIIFAIWFFTKKNDQKLLKRAYVVVWATITIWEVVKMIWESLSGPVPYFEATGILPLYPCSVIMYTLPITIWSKNEVLKAMANGYTCTIGLIGGAINFAYPGTALPNYSALSFVGIHAFLYHGAILFCAITLLTTGEHSYRFAKKWTDLFLATIPILVFSIPANIANYTIKDHVRGDVTLVADYMFFRCDSVFLPAVFPNTPNWVTTILFYIGYIVIPALFYLPSYIARKKKGLI